MQRNMFQKMSRTIRHWYIPLITGVLLTLLGIYIFNVPAATYAVLVRFFSISFVISGVLELTFYIRNRKKIQSNWLHILGAGMVLGVGLFLLTNPAISAFMLALFVTFGLMLKAIQGLFLSFDMKQAGARNWFTLAVLSGLGIMIALLLSAQPMIAGMSLVVLTGMSFLFAGMISILFSLFLKKIKKVADDTRDQIHDLDESEYEVITY